MKIYRTSGLYNQRESTYEKRVYNFFDIQSANDFANKFGGMIHLSGHFIVVI